MQEDLPPDGTPWVVLGDFNEVTTQSEKSGGRPFRQSQCMDLDNFTDAASLVDISYQGKPFTWSNARQGLALIRERLDRALINPAWLDHFPDTKVIHLPKTHSDHCPILLCTALNDLQNNHHFPFRCKEAWLSHPDFHSFFINNWTQPPVDFLQGSINFSSSISHWNQNVFGNIIKKKRKLLARINGIQNFLASKNSIFLSNLEKDLLSQLNNVLNIERIIWAQKAGIDWRKHMDYNTKYFHIIAKIKKPKIRSFVFLMSSIIWFLIMPPSSQWLLDFFRNSSPLPILPILFIFPLPSPTPMTSLLSL